MKNTVVGLFDSMTAAQDAVRALKDAGFSGSDISLVANDLGGTYGKSLKTTKGDNTASGAAGGATAGAVLGGIGGLLVGLGALVIPGIGPVIAAGPLAAGLAAIVGAGAGAVAGGVAGGLLGALIDLGVPKEEAEYYAEGVRRGGALVSVHTDDTKAPMAQRILQQYQPVNLQQRVEQWRQSGWKGYDPKGEPYTNDMLQRERSMYGSSTTTSRTTTTTSGSDYPGTRVYTGK
jgi:hypothetical protein